MIVGGAVALVFVAGVAVWAMLPGKLPTVPPQASAISPPPQAAVTPPTTNPTPAPTQQATNVAPSEPAPPAKPAPSTSPFVVPPAAVETPPASPEPPPQATNTPPAIAVPAPTPAAPPPRSAADISAALAASLPAVKCFLGQATTAADGVVTVSGIDGIGAPDSALRQAVAAADPKATTWQVRGFDGPYCPALDLLQPAGHGGLEFSQIGGTKSLADNQIIALQATMPGFAGYLHVAYLQHDSTVSPLVPGAGYPQQLFGAHAHVELGSPRKDFDGWRVGPPFGTDMIVAVASSAPLFTKPLPDGESLSAYLAALQSAIDALRHRGGSVAASAVVLETSPAH
jgi:serine/threonine-protein kinase